MDNDLLCKIQKQLDDCYKKWGSYSSRHKALGVLIEEIAELHQCVFEKDLNIEETESEIIDCLVVLFKMYQDVCINKCDLKREIKH